MATSTMYRRSNRLVQTASSRPPNITMHNAATSITKNMVSEAQLCVSRLCCTMGFTQRGEPYAGLMGTYAVILQESNTGKILDIQFREVAPPAWQHFHGTVARATKEPQE